MAQVEVSFRPIVGDENLAMLKGRHRAGVDVQIGVELAQPHGKAAGLQQRAQRRRCQPLAKRGDHTAGYENESRHVSKPSRAGARRIISGLPLSLYHGI